ncbi:hypothetical protein WN48_01032 [Eufriesea mexicana]|nr:hypothetical protein WN48_01032 [Eufriesea mexicana]
MFPSSSDLSSLLIVDHIVCIVTHARSVTVIDLRGPKHAATHLDASGSNETRVSRRPSNGGASSTGRADRADRADRTRSKVRGAWIVGEKIASPRIPPPSLLQRPRRPRWSSSSSSSSSKRSNFGFSLPVSPLVIPSRSRTTAALPYVPYSSFCSSPRVKTAINPKKKEENRLRRSFEKISAWFKVVVGALAENTFHCVGFSPRCRKREARADFNEVSNANNALKRSIKGLVYVAHDVGQRSSHRHTRYYTP